MLTFNIARKIFHKYLILKIYFKNFCTNYDVVHMLLLLYTYLYTLIYVHILISCNKLQMMLLGLIRLHIIVWEDVHKRQLLCSAIENK